MTEHEPRFSVTPDRIATWANAITVGRLLFAPLVFWAIPGHNEGSWIAVGLWFVLCASDGIDGYLARRHGTTSAGAFLDPLADKVLVLGAMFTLVGTGMFWAVPVILIAAREIIISVYRVLVGGRGISVPASKMGKHKTVVQQLAVGAALLPWTATTPWLWNSLLWLAVALSLASGAQYLWRARLLRDAADQTSAQRIS